MKSFSHKLMLAVCMLVLSSALVSSEVKAEVRYFVTQDGVGEKDGSSWENATDDLKGLMNSLEGEADIWVALGIYSPGIESDDSFVLKKGLKLYGGFAGTETKIDERDVKRNVTVLSGGKIPRRAATVTTVGNSSSEDTCIDGFSITGGVNVRNGGGIYVDISGSPLISQCIFTENIAYECGAGIYNYYSSPLILNCIFSGNKALNDGGGGVYNHYSSPVFENCTFLSNEAYSGGGGMLSSGSILKVLDSAFSGNKSSFRGGGMSGYNSTLEVKNCIFDENVGEEYGGGMHNEDSIANISHCVFLKNKTSPGNGGGMANVNSMVKTMECKFSTNTAAFYGGGIISFNSSLEISDCVFAENKALRFNGGGMTNWTATMTMNNSRFTENVAIIGGGIYNKNSTSVIENSVFSGNKAKNNSDIEDDESKTTLNSCIFEDIP